MRGACLSREADADEREAKRRRTDGSLAAAVPCGNGAYADEREAKRRRKTDGSLAAAVPCGNGAFEDLPDELVLSIIAAVAASADSPADLAATMLTCKKFRELGQHELVFAGASPRCITVRANAWSDDAYRFLTRCSGAGNINASYLLGMIEFYCLGGYHSGLELMSQAALRGHAEALYSLAIIHFNGSGPNKANRYLHTGARLCARAAKCGHNDALRELGHCISDGYGVPKSVSLGSRLLNNANVREICTVFKGHPVLAEAFALRGKEMPESEVPPEPSLVSKLDCYIAKVASRSVHQANTFLTEWFASRPVGEISGGYALRLCSKPTCGRPETRQNEFRRCAVCTVVLYCSRGCQALHWRAEHKKECTPVNQLLLGAANADVGAALNANINGNAVVDEGANADTNAGDAAVPIVGGGAAPIAGDGDPDAAVVVHMPMQ